MKIFTFILSIAIMLGGAFANDEKCTNIEGSTWLFEVSETNAGSENLQCSAVTNANCARFSRRTNICKNVCELTFDKLILERGASIRFPPDCELASVVAGNAIIRGNNLIQIDKSGFFPGSAPNYGAQEAVLDIRINNATLDFPPITTSPAIEYERGATVRNRNCESFFCNADLQLYFGPHGSGAGDYRPLQKLAVKGGGLVLSSRGSMGKQGQKGSKGSPARRKNCGSGSGSGDEAGQGGIGQSGAKGGKGGRVTGEIIVSNIDRQQITAFDILALAPGGLGGRGGDGGDGGDGVEGHPCFPVGRRSGFPNGPPGGRGPVGPIGDDGSTNELLVSFE